ncbi:MAG: hypothetical protein DPW18_13125 [Chloroflexi bacterium]|nr:hypothetical protein [Chloroflexota bacterium]MDL1941999.1 hypothetical protein [Chloroflexi bacterium CFX2]
MEIVPIYTKIEKIIEIKTGTVVMESPNGFPIEESNLYMISPAGETLWKAEKPDSKILFAKVKLNDNYTISTFTTNGLFCDINLETGKIISSSSFR